MTTAASWGPLLTVTIGLSLLVPAHAQDVLDCPVHWFESGGSCYEFVSQPLKTYQEAVLYCQQSFSSVLSINSASEHRFIETLLQKYDTENQPWLTSGYLTDSGQLIWESDGSEITTDYFSDNETRNTNYWDPLTNIKFNHIVYIRAKTSNQYVWGWQRIMKLLPFVCELVKTDVWKLYQQKRDFSFGTGVTDPNQWLMGPNITMETEDTVFVDYQDGTRSPVVLECVATGNPPPTYRWLRQSVGLSTQIEVTSALNSRYTVTNGRLTIDNPSLTDDVSKFTCEASNKFGTVLSNPVRVSYGQIGDFSPVQINSTTAKKYYGVEVSCAPPPFKPAATFTWFKQDVYHHIRPSLNPQYFLSMNGKFYISEVQDADKGNYFCSMFLSAGSGQQLATSQPPSRTSRAIPLLITGDNANTYGPDIQDKFPQVFPTDPMVGEPVYIECLAYGRLPLSYSWVRDDAPLNPKAKFTDHDRVLTIPNARLEDTGSYTCIVQGVSNTRNKTRHLRMYSRPYFPYPLVNQHVDAGQDLTLKCNAIAVPHPVYTWYRDGAVLTSSTEDRITVNRNILTIGKVEAEKHDGMYQCEAKNDFGSARTSTQLRALSFPPTFENSPVEESKQATAGGNVTIACRPQAAPRAQIQWFRNGVEIGQVLPNGALQLSKVTTADQGSYTCKATNALGTASSTSNVLVVEGTTFDEAPADVRVEVNSTVAIPCKASFDPTKTDIVYTWRLQDHVLDFLRDVNYIMPYLRGDSNSGTLYIVDVQFKHEGMYRCTVGTVTGEVSSEAYVTVMGPPGEPWGVRATNVSSVTLSLDLWWQPGLERGYLITKYRIEMRSFFDDEDEWTLVDTEIPQAATMMAEWPEWRKYRVTKGLSPGTSYSFRVYSGSSQVGYSHPSMASAAIKMLDAPPAFAPENVGGGGGSVGLLHISWDPLPRKLWGAGDMKYRVYYRRYDEQNVESTKWEKSVVTGRDFYTVLAKELYFTEYQVKIQSGNNMGWGPNSSTEIVYSAEDMPVAQPVNIRTESTNGTAGIVYWKLEPRTREGIRGTIVAFQINYWWSPDTICTRPGLEEKALFIRHYGDVTNGSVIGLIPTAYYCVNVQFLNGAGLGSKTDAYSFYMNDWPPRNYPEYVTVMSHGRESVRLLWRGIRPIFQEDPLTGYKAWWWKSQEDIRSARVTTFGKVMTGILHGVEKDVVYSLRILGYSSGCGDGKKSPKIHFTLGGLVVIDEATTLLKNSASAITPSIQALLPALCLLLALAFPSHVSEW